MALAPEPLMRVRLDALADVSALATLAAFSGVRPSGFSAAWSNVAPVVGGIYLGTQLEAVEIAEQYLSALAFALVAVELAPFVGSVGTTPLDDWLDITPRAFEAKVAGGMSPVEAAVAQANYLSASTSAEAHVVGRDAVATTAESSPRFSSYARIPEPGACDFCLMLASRGAVYSKDTATRKRNGMPYHTRRPDGTGGNCRCTARAMPAGTGDSLWNGKGAPTGNPVGRPAGSKSKPATPATAQQVAETRGNYRANAGTPERAASLQRQVDILRRQQSDGTVSEWGRQRIADLETEIAGGKAPAFTARP